MITRLLGILLLSRQVICFAPNRLQSSTQTNGRYISTTLPLRVDLLEEEQTKIETNNDSLKTTKDFNSGEECVFQDIEVGCLDPMLLDADGNLIVEEEEDTTSWSYKYREFAKTYPNVNNIAIATMKTGSADLLAQVVIGHTPIAEVDWDRTAEFASYATVLIACGVVEHLAPEDPR